VKRTVLVVLLMTGCGGSLLEHWDTTATLDGGDAGTSGTADAGLFCAADDPCTCAPCTDTNQCAPNLTCQRGRRQGRDCTDGRWVCLQ
jgi:hypothetical protein